MTPREIDERAAQQERAALQQQMQDARDDLLLTIGLSLMVQVQQRDDIGSVLSAGSLLQRTETFMKLMSAERASRPK